MVKKRLIIICAFLVICCFIISFTLYLYFLEDEDDFSPLERIYSKLGDTTIDDFAYWLQDIDIEEIKNSKYDLMIIDYSSDGNETGEFSYTNITYMKSSGIYEKYLLAYISIGEAEDYRFYWNDAWDANYDGIPDPSAPDWLNMSNPEWKGNYKVEYWNEDWQDIVYEYLDRIISVGFDGIYMDIIDAYEYFEDNIPHSDWLMIDFVGNISSYVKSSGGTDFFVFVQNGDALLSNSTYLSYIDGIGREDLFYYDDSKTSDFWRIEGISNLNYALNVNKTVLIIDYPISSSKIYNFYDNCIKNGFIPYRSNRELNNLYQYSYYPAI